MIELIVLGTSCMQPTKERNHVGILLNYQTENLLFDCGENIQRQLRIANIKPAKITKIFISHWHGDHVLGLPGLMNSMAADNFSKKLEIYGPKGTKKNIKYLLKAFVSKKIIDYKIIEIGSKTKKINFEDFYIESKELSHGIPCFGYSFIEKDKRRIKANFIQKIPGILLGKLQGGQSIQYNHQIISPKEATFIVPGKKITFIMDTRPCDNYLKLANNSDLLFSESTYLDEHKEKAREFNHMTAKEAGLLANQANVKKLILLHFSPRYKDLSQMREEATTVFKNVICAEDFMKFKV